MKRYHIGFYIVAVVLCMLGFLCMPSSVNAAETTADVATETMATDVTTETEAEPVELISSLKGIIAKTNQYKITWITNVEKASVSIRRASSKKGSYKELSVKDCFLGEANYTDTKLELGKTYYYKITVRDFNTDREEICELKVKSILSTPSSVSVKEGKSVTAKISWKKVSKATGYYIYRSTKKNSGYKKVKTVGKTTSYTDKSIKSGKIYYYKVRAIYKNNSSVKSESSAASMLCVKPAKVKVSGSYKSKKVQLSWKKVTGAKIYYIYKKNSDGKYEIIDSTDELKYSDSDVEKNKEYSYKVRAAYTKDDKMIYGSKSTAFTVYTAAIDPNKKMVALTFDDGPGPYTDAIVDCLKENNARATFFVVGNRVNTYKKALLNAYKAGNEIANHSYDHSNLTGISASAIKKQMNKTDTAVKKITGKATTLVRTPGGAVNSKVKGAVGKPIIFWSIDTLDWKTRSASKTVKAVVNNVKDGDIILMHDIHKPSKEAALELIPKLKKMGYQLVTVSELAKYRGYNLKDGTVYSRLKKK